ncbi:hypothetical protein CEXT_737031 [Caerostris extrusa]|uniref:Uncharacterized protein n=1 Tax=Caerostris extrusa TaxID=172846 RepID=A0AAV4UV09_CAEEX|nr:hypothetical protein CEXT_737031 [Caerostris extrusa]
MSTPQKNYNMSSCTAKWFDDPLLFGIFTTDVVVVKLVQLSRAPLSLSLYRAMLSPWWGDKCPTECRGVLPTVFWVLHLSR